MMYSIYSLSETDNDQLKFYFHFSPEPSWNVITVETYRGYKSNSNACVICNERCLYGCIDKNVPESTVYFYFFFFKIRSMNLFFQEVLHVKFKITHKEGIFANDVCFWCQISLENSS
jgi:hypothetical protein